ncbi:cell wall metabolism sensor histidine kinase WalK [Sebaldella sp. S0638]|uniref:sensor histidine kinase n=1 Tax=Sebaldella sp. S0638 TaxID=2957809 RepID=UPI00209CBA9A|nr:HAMP domain-containing sensor histidine kinase [Sebaldella sp. S0638]MCP1224138.1 HAMP domain-containing histidine kinase [Sebaldella sp. S0638]
MKIKIKKISHKIIIFNTMGILFCTLLIGFVTWFFIINEYVMEENNELDNIANGVTETLQRVPQSHISNFYQSLEFGDKDEILISVKYPDGHIVKLGDSDISYNEIPENNWLLKKRYALHFKEKNINNIEFIFIRKFSYDRVIQTSRIIFYLFILLAVSIIIFSYYMTKNILKPVTYIIKESEKINDKNLNIKLPKIRDDEIGDLIDVINNLFSKMHEILLNQKNFSSNVSHELKTPVAIMKGYLDILKWGKDDPVLLDEALENMETEIANIEKLITNLLFLSQAEKLKTLNEKINLSLLLGKLKNDYRLLKINKELIISCKENTIIYGNQNLIFEALRGIIDNSIKYSTGEKIHIIVESTDTFIKITIRDFGEHISDEDIENIFKRHHRIEKQDIKNTRGLGLGLSIIKEIIELHNAEIKLINRDNGLDTEIYFYNL